MTSPDTVLAERRPSPSPTVPRIEDLPGLRSDWTPEKALSDGAQSLTPAGFATLMESVRAIASVVGLSV